MLETVECPPIVGGLAALDFSFGRDPFRGVRGIGQEGDLHAGMPERDRLFLKVDLGALKVGVGECADEQKPHRR